MSDPSGSVPDPQGAGPAAGAGAPGGAAVLAALRRRWLLVVLTPVVTLALATAFLFVARPLFDTSTSLRFVEERSPIGGGMATGLAALESGSAAGGLSALAGLAGQGIPIQTEMVVLQSRSLAGALLDELGLRMEVQSPGRQTRSTLFGVVRIGADTPDGDYDLRRQADGSFSLTASIVVARNPFRPFFRKTRKTRDLGTVRPGGVLPIPGAHVTLAKDAASYGEIRFRILSMPDAVKRVMDAITVTRPQRDADVVRVAVRWPEPYLAAAMADSLTATFIRRKASTESEDFDRMAAFLGHQLDSLQAQLDTAEVALKDYSQRENAVAPTEQAKVAVDQLATLESKRDLLSSERSALLRLLDDLRKSTTGADSLSTMRRLVFFPSLLTTQSTAAMLQMLGELENERAQLLERFTPESHDVGVLTERAHDIELELRDAAETYLDGLEKQVAAIDQVLGRYQDQLARIPAVEMQYERRKREVQVLTQLYVYMQNRRKAAQVTAAGQSRGVRVVDRAEVPIKPSRPRPALTLLLALVVGLILGVGGAVALEQGIRW